MSTPIDRKLRRILVAASLTGLLALTAATASASAFTEPGITGNWTDFANCSVRLVQAPPGAFRGGYCAHSYTTGGVVQIGHSSVPISVPGDTFDAGATEEEPEGVEAICAPFRVVECAVAPPHGILNGPVQPVPGGLLGTIGNVQLTGVSAKLEWAAPVRPGTAFGTAAGCTAEAPMVTLNICKLLNGISGTATTLSVKVHLMSPFLGANCYIGSAASPIVIALTTGTTSPPPPAKPIHGFLGVLYASGSIEVLTGVVLVNNSFSVPVANGCGTTGGGLADSSIDHKLGLPSPPGQNMMVIDGISEAVGAREVLEHGVTGE